jgi:benzoyl-CoA reductase/2-hydroxyglutaryl-CoA dehydratase subunit BcrC/BadD/HgdB
VFNNRTKDDVQDIFQSLNRITVEINKLHRVNLPVYTTFDADKLNYLHEEFEKFEIVANLLKEIDSDMIKKKINNYIAPYFGLVK